LYDNNPKFDRNFRVIVENRLIETENRVLQAISSTAEERYLAFIKQYPHAVKTSKHTNSFILKDYP